MNDANTKEFHRFTLRINKKLFEIIQKSADENKRAIGKEIEFVLEKIYLKTV